MIKYSLFLILCITFALPLTALADQGAILRVIDGDTLVVKVHNKIEHVRILGIDTPELHTYKTRVAQCYAREAFQEVKKLVKANKKVTIQRDALTKNRDAYGRYLRHVSLGTTSIAEHLIKNGFAKVYTRSPISSTPQLLALQQEARISRRGLWKWCK